MAQPRECIVWHDRIFKAWDETGCRCLLFGDEACLREGGPPLVTANFPLLIPSSSPGVARIIYIFNVSNPCTGFPIRRGESRNRSSIMDGSNIVMRCNPWRGVGYYSGGFRY